MIMATVMMKGASFAPPSPLPPPQGQSTLQGKLFTDEQILFIGG